MGQLPDPPAVHQEFVTRYPALGQAWELIAAAGKEGTLGMPSTVAAFTWVREIVHRRGGQT